VGLEAREIPAVGEVFSLDFPLYRTSSPPQAARVPTASRFVFPEMASVGSSHNRSTSAEDHEEALLLGCPPIGRSGRRNMEQFGRKRKRGLISSA